MQYTLEFDTSQRLSFADTHNTNHVFHHDIFDEKFGAGDTKAFFFEVKIIICREKNGAINCENTCRERE